MRQSHRTRPGCARRFPAPIAILLTCVGCASGRTPVLDEFSPLLERQAAAWNRGDIDGFMELYWKSDELTFSGGGQTTRGWAATRDRYRARYPTPERMGRLTFSSLERVPLPDRDVALLLGCWKLERQPDPAEGNFSLVWARYGPGGSWVIVHDHSSSTPASP